MTTPPAPDTGGQARLPAAIGLVAAALAASCCLLPLALIATGLAGAGLMMTMMQFEWLTLPLGVGGLAGAYVLYLRERRRCDTAGCRLVGDRGTQVLLGLATVVVVVALVLKFFPSWSANLLQRLDFGLAGVGVVRRCGVQSRPNSRGRSTLRASGS